MTGRVNRGMNGGKERKGGKSKERGWRKERKE